MNLPAVTQQMMPQPHVPQPMPQPVPLGLSVSAEQKLELLEYWRSIKKRRWLILALATVATLLAAVVAMALTPIYRSTASVLVEAGKGKILSIEDIYSSTQAREHYQTQVEVIKSREVAQRAVQALELWNHPLFDPRQQSPSLRDRAKAALGMGDIKTEWTDEELSDVAVKKLMEDATVEPVRLSQLVKINVDSPDRRLAAMLANTIANEYIQADLEAKVKISQGVSAFLQERLPALREQSLAAEQALQNYREKKGIVNLGGSAQTIVRNEVGGTADKLMAARSRRMELESSFQQLKRIKNNDVSGVPAIMRDPLVASALANYNDVERQLAQAQITLGSRHPKVRQLQSDLQQLASTLDERRAAAEASLRREYEAAASTEASLERALGKVRGDVQTVNRDEFQLAVLEREAKTNADLYDMFMSRAKETSLSSSVQAAVARVIDPAVPTSETVKPKRMQIVTLTAILAIFAGALGALLMDRMDNTVKGGEDAELRLKQPLLAALPEVPELDRPHMARLFLDDAHSHFSEAIRTARTGIMLSSLDVKHKILLITSCLPGEGKTTVSVNLALAHAQTKKTLLIDADMRRSQVSRSMGIPPGAKGLSNLVAGSAPLEECLHGVADSTLTVLPVGDLPPNPLELLLSQRFKDTLAKLSEEYEMVIIDSPPVELVSEALVLAPMATNVAFVVKAMSTPAPLVRKSLARIQRAGGNILGMVVNQLDFKQARLYYGEYGASSYNYGSYGYGAKLPYVGGKNKGVAPDSVA